MNPRLPLSSAAALLTLSGCGMLGIHNAAPKPLAAPTTRPEQPNADASRESATQPATVSTRNTPVAESPTAQSILPGKPPKPATPAPLHTVAETLTANATQPADPGNPLAAMGSMAASPVSVTPDAAPTMAQILSTLRQRIGTGGTAAKSINQALALQLLELADSGRAEDLTALGVSADDNKIVSELATAIQGMAASGDRTAPLVKAAKAWESAGDLKLPTLALASRVDSFGVYTPVENKFPAGKRSVVIIYCEVKNFTSEKADDIYLTHLTQQDTLVTDDGLMVWRPSPEDIEDRCRNLRHDFYLIKKLTLPDTLSAGKYTLQMTVVDKLGNKRDTATLPIEIVR